MLALKRLNFRRVGNPQRYGKIHTRSLGGIVVAAPARRSGLPIMAISCFCAYGLTTASSEKKKVTIKHIEVLILSLFNVAYPLKVNSALDDVEFKYFIKGVEAENPGRSIFILFQAEVSPATGKMWCPDCERGRPVIISALEKYAGDAVLVTCHVNRAAYKGDNYPFRVNPSIGIQCVPTLMRCSV